MQHWFPIARVGDIADREWKVVSINGSDVAVFNLNGEYLAIDSAVAQFPCDQCAGSWGSDGVMYPWRVPEPSTRAGTPTRELAYQGARRFPVRVRAGNIEVCEEAT